LKERGRIKENTFADVVVFNPETVADKSTFQNPHQYPEGIDFVMVNGVLAVDGGEFVDARSGVVLRKGKQ
ncbi:MAG: D-aminoacylase, partial [Cyclobacteriaceae bacterium]